MNNGNIDISLTLGTRADMSGIDQVRKGVDDLSTAANGLPRELMSGGVGAVADARSFSGSPSGGKMTLQVDGLDRLAGTIARVEGAVTRSVSTQGRTDAALEDMQAGIGRVAEMVEEVSCGASSGASSPPASAPTSAGNEWMMARLDQIAALLTRMDATLAKSVATTKPEGPQDQLRKGIDGLTQAVKTAPVMSSGGVGGQTGAVPAYPASDNGTSPSPKDWSVRIDGLDALGATVQGADKTVGKATDAVGRQSGWLQRSIEALTKIPGQMQSWAGGQMQGWRKFNGGLQNATNILSLGKQAWDLGWKAGDALKDAFGLGAKKVSAQMADMLAKGKAKVEAWQAGLAAELGRMNQEAALKKENALVKQINDAYDARKRTIEALDEKAARNLETQAKILAIENETSRSIIRQKQIRGEITESQARDALASIDAKDATERRAIDRQQAENALKKAEALAEAKAEQIRRMQELSASSPAAAGVNGLEPKDFYKQADAFKNSEAALKAWKELEARRVKLQEEVDEATATMVKVGITGVGIALIPGLLQKKAQDEETLNSVMAEMDGMRKDYKMPEATNGQMAARLAAEKKQQQAALDKMMEGIKNTGLLGDVRGKDGTALYMAYAKALEMAQSVITGRAEALTALFKEQGALDDSVAVARNRLGNLMRVQRIEVKGEATRKKETDKTNAWQDNQKRDSTVTRTMAEGLVKAVEKKRKALDANKKALDTAKETYEASLESFSNFAEKYAEKDEKARANADKFVNTLNKLKTKDKKNWGKQDKDDEKWVEKFLLALKNKYGNDYNSERDKGMVLAASQAWKKMNEILSRKQNVPKQEDEIRNLEEAARKASNLPEDIQQKNTAAMELTEWMRKFREEKVPRAGTLAENSDYEILYQVEDVVRKALQDGKVDKGERGQLQELLTTLRQNNIGPDETPAIHEMVTLVREILGKYSSSQAAARKLLAEVAELKSRLNKIDSQRGYGH